MPPTRLDGMAEFIYTMRKARKAHGDKVILDDVTLSFLPGAKIGVVGPNGAGKSTVLKIMAGLDQPSNGDAMLVAGLHRRHPRAGAAAQRGQGRARQRRGGRRRDQGASSTASTRSPSRWRPSYSDDAARPRWASCRRSIDHANAWDLDAQLEQAMDALRCPPPDADVTVLSGGERRRVALCKLLLEAARPAAARRAHQPPRRRERAVAGAAPGEVRRHRRRRHPRPVLPRQRRRVDPRARPRPRLPVRGQLLDLPGDQGDPPQGRGPARTPSAPSGSRTSWSGCAPTPRAARPRARPASSATRRWPPRPRRPASSTSRRSRSRRARAWAASSSRSTNLTKGFGDRVLIDDLSFTLPRNGIVGVIGPNGAGKTTLFKMIIGEEKPDNGEHQGRRDRQDLLRRPEPRRHRPARRRCGRSSPTGSTTSRSARSRCRPAPTSRAFGFKGPDQQKPAGVLSGGERNRLNLALTLKQGGNLLLLDEPTNDLDVETLSSLENALLEFPGCAVVVSHDRWFLDRVATHILAYEGDSQVVLVRGQLRVVREEQGRAARRRRGPPAPRHLPQAHPRLTARSS